MRSDISNQRTNSYALLLIWAKYRLKEAALETSIAVAVNQEPRSARSEVAGAWLPPRDSVEVVMDAAGVGDQSGGGACTQRRP
jgi:hypothetical protein